MRRISRPVLAHQDDGDIARQSSHGYTYNLIPTNSYYLSPLFETEAPSDNNSKDTDNAVARAISEEGQKGGKYGGVGFYYPPYYNSMLQDTVVRPVLAKADENVVDVSEFGFH